MKFIAQVSFNSSMQDLGESPTYEGALALIENARREHYARWMFDGHYWINPGDEDAMDAGRCRAMGL